MSATAKEESAHGGHGSGAVYKNTNGVPVANGKTTHLDVGRGDVANRVLTVGAVQRAELIAGYLDARTKTVSSSRGFTIITGIYKGVAVSIVAIGMGPPMMDFFVRETRYVTDGPMAIARFGTCGGISEDAVPGTIVVANGSGFINRNPNAFSKTRREGVEPYILYDEVPADSSLTSNIVEKLTQVLGAQAVVAGTNVTADSFYSSQGRVDSDNFDDQNTTLIDKAVITYPNAKSMEMETFQLIHLANCSKVPIYSSAAAIVISNRRDSTKIVSGEVLSHLEAEGGRAMLDALIAFTFP